MSTWFFLNLVLLLPDILFLTYLFYSSRYLVKHFKNITVLREPCYLYLWWGPFAVLIHLLIFLSPGGLLVHEPYHLCEFTMWVPCALGCHISFVEVCMLPQFGICFPTCVVRVHLSSFLCLEQANVSDFPLLTLSPWRAQGWWAAFGLLFSWEHGVFLVFHPPDFMLGASLQFQAVSKPDARRYLFSYSNFVFNS